MRAEYSTTTAKTLLIGHFVAEKLIGNIVGFERKDRPLPSIGSWSIQVDRHARRTPRVPSLDVQDQR